MTHAIVQGPTRIGSAEFHDSTMTDVQYMDGKDPIADKLLQLLPLMLSSQFVLEGKPLQLLLCRLQCCKPGPKL